MECSSTGIKSTWLKFFFITWPCDCQALSSSLDRLHSIDSMCDGVWKLTFHEPLCCLGDAHENWQELLCRLCVKCQEIRVRTLLWGAALRPGWRRAVMERWGMTYALERVRDEDQDGGCAPCAERVPRGGGRHGGVRRACPSGCPLQQVRPRRSSSLATSATACGAPSAPVGQEEGRWCSKRGSDVTEVKLWGTTEQNMSKYVHKAIWNCLKTIKLHKNYVKKETSKNI